MSSYTRTYTATDSKYLGSKIAADLKQLQLLYGEPSDLQIEQYVGEFISLLKDGYLKNCSYGFKKIGKYIVGVSYEIATLTGTDNNPGRIPVEIDISGASWGSFLEYSDAFESLPLAQRIAIKDALPIQRSDGQNPASGVAASYDKSYSSGEVELKRKTFK